MSASFWELDGRGDAYEAMQAIKGIRKYMRDGNPPIDQNYLRNEVDRLQQCEKDEHAEQTQAVETIKRVYGAADEITKTKLANLLEKRGLSHLISQFQN